MGSMVLALSGGADSSFLLKVASGVLPKKKLLAVTANSATYPQGELRLARALAKELGVRHKIIRSAEIRNKNFYANPQNRCYFCKQELFRRLQRIAGAERLNFIADASNTDDKNDFRPWDKAKKAFRVRSPLQDAGFSKADVRAASRQLGLMTWDKPQAACLASRIPYGVEITSRLLRRVEKAEDYLRGLGLRQVRLRHYPSTDATAFSREHLLRVPPAGLHNGLCRIETSPEEMPLLFKRRAAAARKLRQLGYRYITLDLEGYRCGSLNEAGK